MSAPNQPQQAQPAAANAPSAPSVFIVTTPYVSGWKIQSVRGHVFGLVVRSRGLGGNIMAGLRSLGGGEITEYTQLLEQSRSQAVERLVYNAAAMGANAVISMRFDSSSLADYMTEIVAYGTAVVLVPDPEGGAPVAE